MTSIPGELAEDYIKLNFVLLTNYHYYDFDRRTKYKYDASKDGFFNIQNTNVYGSENVNICGAGQTK